MPKKEQVIVKKSPGTHNPGFIIQSYCNQLWQNSSDCGQNAI